MTTQTILQLLFLTYFILIQAQRWEQLFSTNQPPENSELGGMAVIDNKMYYYSGIRECQGNGTSCGGTSNCVNTFPNRLDAFNLKTGEWTYNVDSSSSIRPGARSTYAYTTYEDKNFLLVYGGVTFQGTSVASCDITFLDGLWAWNSITHQWARLDSATDPNTPGARAGATINIYDDALYLFAGLKAPGILRNDVLKFNFHTNLWTVVNSGGSSPSLPAVRYNQIAFTDEDNDRLLVVWGDNFVTSAIRPQIEDIWQYKFLTNTWQLLESGSQKALYHPVGGLYKDILYFAGGDLRPREYEVEAETAVGGLDAELVVQLPNGTRVIGEGDVDPEYTDPVTGEESRSTDLHYFLDVEPDDGKIKFTQQSYPSVTSGEFKMSAFAPYKDKFVIVRGGFRWYCAKFAPRCTKVYLDNPFKVHLEDLVNIF